MRKLAFPASIGEEEHIVYVCRCVECVMLH